MKKMKRLPFVLLLLLSLLTVSMAHGECSKGDICGKLKAEEAARKEILLKESLKTKKGPSVKTTFPSPPKKNSKTKPSEAKDAKKNTTRRKEKSHRVKKNSSPPRGSSVKRLIATYPVEVHPEQKVWITLSNRDVNRVVCTDGDIESVHYSSEKGIEVSVEGNQAFIKFKVLTNPQTPLEKPRYITVPAEFFINCGGETYEFIARPRMVYAQTVYLVSPGKKIKKTLETFKRFDLVRAVVAVIRPVFRDEVPPSWERLKRFAPARMRLLLPGPAGKETPINIVETERYVIPGVSVMVRVFAVKNADRKNAVQVNERIFLSGSLVVNPVAISLLTHTLPPGVVTKAVVLERLFVKKL